MREPELALSIIDATVNANLTAVVVLSMALTPLCMLVYRLLVKEGQAVQRGRLQWNLHWRAWKELQW